jgi:membrane protein DedA with SNARE-associated domain
VVRWFLPRKRQARVRRSFFLHGKKTVFFARFVAGLRIGVYAYAGQHGMLWRRFVFLDFLGCVVSVPTSIWLGKFVAQKLADPEQAARKAEELMSEGHYWLYVVLGVLVGSFVLHHLWNRWRDRRVARKIATRKATTNSESSASEALFAETEESPFEG